jgi:hypothetical protein
LISRKGAKAQSDHQEVDVLKRQASQPILFVRCRELLWMPLTAFALFAP